MREPRGGGAGERQAHDTIATATWTENPGTVRREVIFRRTVLVGMGLLVLAAALGLLGPREHSSQVRTGQGTLSVTAPQVTRSGLESTVELAWSPGNGRAGEDRAVLTLPQDALALLGVDAVHPEPARQTARDGAVSYEFDLSADQAATVTLSGRMPTKQPPGRTRWWVEWSSGTGTARVDTTTWVLP